MDLSSRKSISITSLCYFLALGYHISLGNNDSSALRLGAMVAMLVLYVIMVFARWQRDRTTRAWAVPLALAVVGLVAAFAIIATSH